MRERNEAIFRRWVKEVWNEGNEQTIDELFDKNAVATYPVGLENKPLYGIEEYKQFVRFVRRFFSDINLTIEQIAVDEKKVVSYCTFHATSVLAGSDSAVEPASISVSGLCQIIVEGDKIVQAWSNIDLSNIRDLHGPKGK